MAFAHTHEYSPGGALPALSILYTNCEEAVHKWLASVASSAVFGFDTENRPVFRKGQSSQLALIQLSTRTCALVVQWSHYQRAPAASPASHCLARFFCNPALSLCGMGCVSDFRQWARELQGGGGGEAGAGGGRQAPRPALLELEQLRGGLDLAGAAKGLAGLCQLLIPEVQKWKSKRIQMSNWEASPLSVAQIVYAAMDGWAGLAAYEAIAAARQSAPAGGAGGSAVGGAVGAAASSSSGAEGAEAASGAGAGAGAGAGGSAPPPFKRQRCKFFNRPGGCRKGDSCPHEHCGLAAAEGGSGGVGGGRKVCPFFNSYSGCTKGSECPMLHVEDEE